LVPHSELTSTQPPPKHVMPDPQVPARLVVLQRLAVATRAPSKQLLPASQAPLGFVGLHSRTRISVFVLGVQPTAPRRLVSNALLSPERRSASPGVVRVP